jgi:hypothetical protein
LVFKDGNRAFGLNAKRRDAFLCISPFSYLYFLF